MQFDELLSVAKSDEAGLARLEGALAKAHATAAGAVSKVSEAARRYDETLLGDSIEVALNARESLVLAEAERDRIAAIVRLLERRIAGAAPIAYPGGGYRGPFSGIGRVC
jgi:hypothetical protein